jgi:hypothetical protein
MPLVVKVNATRDHCHRGMDGLTQVKNATQLLITGKQISVPTNQKYFLLALSNAIDKAMQ